MRLHALYLTGALMAMAIPAGAVSARADHQTAEDAQQVVPASYTCTPGYYCEPDAYAPHGKFRPAHCAPR
jgi:hypothetical protein